MKRILDANLVMAGNEPKVAQELTNSELGKILNWYSQNKVAKDAQKYASDYFKKRLKTTLNASGREIPTTFGFVCRILSNGASITGRDLDWFNEIVEQMKSKKAKKIEDVPEKINVVSIQDRVNEKVSEIIGELEGAIDDYIISKFKTIPSPYGIMHDKAKAMHAIKIIEWFSKRQQEYDEVINTDDVDLKEGYSNFSKNELKKLWSFCGDIITDAMKIADESKATRKPRKKKSKSPEQLVAKVQYAKECEEYKLKSEDPKQIIGSTSIWVFNTKTRKLGVYHALDSQGFGVKGTSLTNFSEMKSVQKTLRKPEAILPDVVKGAKVFLRNAMESVNSKASGLTGRLNSDTILIKIIK